MNESFKLEQARYFLDRMQEAAVYEDDLHFRYNLGAFLTSARSVLQYAIEEAKSRNQQQWYDRWMSQSQLLRDCKDWRDEDIHQQCPVAVATTLSLTRGMALWGCGDPAQSAAPQQTSGTPGGATTAGSAEPSDENAGGECPFPPATTTPVDEQAIVSARLLETRSVPPAVRREHAQEPPRGSDSRRYTNPERFGDQDIVALCEQYLQELHSVVASGQAQGVLTAPGAIGGHHTHLPRDRQSTTW